MNRIMFLALALALVAVLVAFLGRRRRVLAGGGLLVALVGALRRMARKADDPRVRLESDASGGSFMWLVRARSRAEVAAGVTD
jgi:hypothetical protein